MASSRKSTNRRQKSTSGDGMEGRTEERSDGDAATMENLKQFVREMKKSRGRAVEMRLAILCSIAIVLRVLYSERIAATSAAHSVFFFALLGILIIVLTTWLDYYPSRMEIFKLRNAGGQGLPLACLLPSMVCIAVLCYVADQQPELIDTICLYLVLCCTATIATILPTILQSAPYPNSIVIYNLLLFILIFAVNTVLQTPYFPLIIHCSVYSILVPLFLYHFPESFTLCEASLVSQGVSLLITDTTMQISNQFGLYDLDPAFSVTRSDALLFLQVGVTGFVICCSLFSYFLYKIALSNDAFYIHVWSAVFLQLSFVAGVFIMLPWLQTLMNKPPIFWLFGFVFEKWTRIYLVLYWICAVGVAVFIVFSQSATGRLFSVLKVENPSSLWMRKWFHLLALAVYIPGIIIDPPLLSLAASIVTVQFLVIELLRVFRIWPVGEKIHKVLAPFVDSRDAGELILTHIYLLLGFSIPLWLFPLSKLNTVVKMSMYAGTLSLGVGDSIAAVSGTLIGRNKWPGTKKTVEGTLMSVFCQIIVTGLIVLLDADLPPLSQYHWCVLGASIFLGAAMEAYTHQIDNLILGVFQFALCIAFL